MSWIRQPKMPDISIELCGISMENPTVLASGIMGVTPSSMRLMAGSGAGAVTMKSVNIEGKKGHPNPIALTFERGMINAVGLPNKGVFHSIEEIREYRMNTHTPIIGSVFEKNADDFGKVTKLINQAPIDLLEVNISCPNVDDEFGKPFSCDPVKAAEVTRICKKNSKVPVFVKLSPNVPDIAEVAREVEKAGADGITAINTAGPGMVIDITSAKPILANKAGGISGAAIRPLAVRCVYDIYRAVKIPIIGTGGVITGHDAVEMLMAGASAVGMGTAVYNRGLEVFSRVCGELEDFMEKNGYSSIKELVGKAHDE